MIVGKRKLCFIEVSDFTNIQGVGNDPIYRRYNSVYAIVKQYIAEDYQSFLAEPEYSESEDCVFWYTEEWGDTEVPVRWEELDDSSITECKAQLNRITTHYREVAASLSGEKRTILEAAIKYINEQFVYVIGDKLILAVWGMQPDEYRHNGSGVVVHDMEHSNFRIISFDSGLHGEFANPLESRLKRRKGAILAEEDLPTMVAHGGYEFVGWSPDPIGVEVTKNRSFTAQYCEVQPEPEKTCHVRFVGESSYCGLEGPTEIEVPVGATIPINNIPMVSCNPGYKFVRWSEDIQAPVTSDMVIFAELESDVTYITANFCAGDNGTLDGASSISLPVGTSLVASQIPMVKAKSGYRFVGWDNAPLDLALNEDVTFTARYEKITPWWVWLLRVLGFILLLLLFLFLLSLVRGCDHFGCSAWSGRDHNDPPQIADTSIYRTPIAPPHLGENIDPGNGDNDYHVGVVPPNPEYRPIPNPEDPAAPQIFPDRFNIFFEDNSADLNAFAQDFRAIYPDTQKYQIDYDDNIKRITIILPPDERESVKARVENELGNRYSFFIVDESVIMQQANVNTLSNADARSRIGWHLDAINAHKAWEITRGSSDVIVAVVDDGFDVEHDSFKNKIVAPYNIFSKNSQLTYGEGHGTHVAGLAVGLPSRDGMASGIAPNCKLMPIQVFIDGVGATTTSAMISGVAYAIHKGADVINMSIGPSLYAYNVYSLEDQQSISQQIGKVEERLWRRVLQMAHANNVVLVFSAGNDNVLSNLNPQNRPDSIISVTAVDIRLQKSIYEAIDGNNGGSNYGDGSTIAAPGSDIYSSFPVNTYKTLDGTSMAAPIVSGVVALLKSEKRDISAGAVIDVLKRSGKQLSDNTIGPLLQADRALVLLRTGSLPSDDESSNGEENAPVDDSNQPRDYSSIHNKIKELRREIDDLISQLPEDEKTKVNR